MPKSDSVGLEVGVKPGSWLVRMPEMVGGASARPATMAGVRRTKVPSASFNRHLSWSGRGDAACTVGEVGDDLFEVLSTALADDRGGDEDADVVGLWVACHLELVHLGRLAAAPPAEHVRWTLGRRPLLVVDGRERRR